MYTRCGRRDKGSQEKKRPRQCRERFAWRIGLIHTHVAAHAASHGETGTAPPAADEASLFRGCGTIGERKAFGNRPAATVGERHDAVS